MIRTEQLSSGLKPGVEHQVGFYQSTLNMIDRVLDFLIFIHLSELLFVASLISNVSSRYPIFALLNLRINAWSLNCSYPYKV